MKIRLSNKDAVQLAKAIKSGCLDTDKVEFMKELVANYNPPKRISDEKLEYYKRCLYDGMGFTPNSEDEFNGVAIGIEQADPELYDGIKEHIQSGRMYKQFVQYIFIGLVALRSVGGKFDFSKQPDFSFVNKPTPNNY